MAGENNILGLYPDSGIYWTADDIPELGIYKNQRLDVALSKIAKAFVEYKSQKIEIGDLGTAHYKVAEELDCFSSYLFGFKIFARSHRRQYCTY